jgi:3-oxoacyl-[acyl-carrier protein] reductase
VARTALVTGASRGIGRATAERLAKEGWDLLLTARRLDPLAEACRALSAHGGSISSIAVDLTDESGVDRLVDRFLERQVALDLLVLAAGVGSAGPVAGFSLKRLDLQVSVNLRASFQLVSRLLPALRQGAEHNPQLGARIVALSSITGHVAEPGLSAYGATKAALSQFCESVTSEESVNGVLATAIAPGYVNTEMSDWVKSEVSAAQMIHVDDIVEIVIALAKLSRFAAVPNIVVTRPGPNLYRA